EALGLFPDLINLGPFSVTTGRDFAPECMPKSVISLAHSVCKTPSSQRQRAALRTECLPEGHRRGDETGLEIILCEHLTGDFLETEGPKEPRHGNEQASVRNMGA